MKSILRSIFINLASMFIIAKTLGGIAFSDKIAVLFWAALCLSVFNIIVKPVLNLLLMPINLLTLGAFRWVINVIVLFLVTIFVPGFVIGGIVFPGLAVSGFIIPAINLSFFWSLILLSFVIEIMTGFISWILK